jgi:hypothetical protein
MTVRGNHFGDEAIYTAVIARNGVTKQSITKRQVNWIAMPNLKLGLAMTVRQLQLLASNST